MKDETETPEPEEATELKISSKSFEEFRKESLERMEKFERGEKVPHTVNFEDPTKLRKVLTSKRIEIIKFLMDNQVESIQGLAEKLGRGIKEVSQDLELLEEYGIVRMEKKGRAKKPSVPYNRINIDIGIQSKSQNQGKIEKGAV